MIFDDEDDLLVGILYNILLCKVYVAEIWSVAFGLQWDYNICHIG